MANYQIQVYGGTETPRVASANSLVTAAIEADHLLPNNGEYEFTLRAVFDKGDGKFGDVPRELFNEIMDELMGLDEPVKSIAGHILGMIYGVNLFA